MYYYLEVTRGIEKGRRYPVMDGAASIGRSSTNTVALCPTEKGVSGHHAILYRNGETFLVQDLESTNGTYVNEERIKEQSLSVNDEIGCGKAGPRLKLIASERELTVAAVLPRSMGIDTADMTSGERLTDLQAQAAAVGSATDSTDGDIEARQAYERERAEFLDEQDQQAPSMTIDLEKKILERRLDSGDMRKLMRNSERMGKIIDRGNLGETQTNLLRVTYEAHRSTKWRWFAVAGGLLTVTLGVALFFGIRAYQYKSLLKRGLMLGATLNEQERRIAQAQQDSTMDPAQLKALILQLETANAELRKVKSQVSSRDIVKFYNDPLEETIDRILMRFGETDYHIPPQMVERVRHHIEVFTGPLRGTMGRYIKRKDQYFPMIERVFRERKLPDELKYVSMLESGFNPMALSHAGARGLWQFMEATGRRYGLRVDGAVDERTDPEKATHAAAQYFKDLIGIFGGRSSIMLAMAAYNAGEGRIMGALRKIDDPMRNRDFWYIYRMGVLAEETNEYIPKILAMMIITENPQKYGLGTAPAEPERGLPEFTLEEIGTPLGR